jgi:tetratricopeptide (TPR) repeat protein
LSFPALPEVYLAGRGEEKPAATSVPPPQPAASEAERAWDRTKDTTSIALLETLLSLVLSELGRFDPAIEYAGSAVKVAEAANDPFTLYLGYLALGLAHLRRGDLPRAMRVLERDLDVCRTWQFHDRTANVAAALGAAYALAGRADEAHRLVAAGVEEFRRRPIHVRPAYVLLSAGRICLSAGRISEAGSHTQEALALTRRLGARGNEAHALCLNGDIAAAAGHEDAEGYYRQALALAEPRGMRPLVAHCHLGLGKLYRCGGNREKAQEHLTTAMAMYREMGMIYWPDQVEAELRQLG